MTELRFAARTTLAALLSAAFLALPARAAEKPPDLNWGGDTKTRIETYCATGAHVLKDILTPMVERTLQGEEYLGSQWPAEASKMVRMIKDYSKHSGSIPELKRWYDAELAAWTNIDKVGRELLDLHYYRASTLEEVEQDVKDSKAYYARLKDYIGKANDDAGRLNEYLGAAGKATDRLDKFGELVGKISTVSSLMSDHTQTVARLIRQFHVRQIEFIKDRGRLDKHKAALDKLKSFNLDPDQTGVFATYEKKWEETMYKTYARYVDAVEDWQKESRWHDGRDQLYAALKTLLTKWMTMPHTFLGVGLPPFMPTNAEKLGEHCLSIRKAVTKAIEKFKGEEWAKLEEGLQTAEEDRRQLRADFEKQLDTIDEEARMKVATADEECERITAPLESRLNVLASRYGSETDSSAKDAIQREMREVERKMDDAERGLEKSRRYCLGEYQRRLEEEAYKEFREAIRKIDDRVKECNKLKGQLRR